MSVSHPTVTQFPKAAVFSSTLGCSTITAIPVLVVSDLGRCALLLKMGPFLIAWFILTRVVPFYLCLLHVYIVSHIAQKKNNIKCIIFVVFEMPLCHLSCAEDGAETASRSVGSWLIVCDSRITDGDIYLCLPYCLSQIK